MISSEERRLIGLVAKFGCVDLRAIRAAYRKTQACYDPILGSFDYLFIYYYLTETDPDGDEIMRER